MNSTQHQGSWCLRHARSKRLKPIVSAVVLAHFSSFYGVVRTFESCWTGQNTKKKLTSYSGTIEEPNIEQIERVRSILSDSQGGPVSFDFVYHVCIVIKSYFLW
jgi:hypothetical protein